MDTLALFTIAIGLLLIIKGAALIIGGQKGVQARLQLLYHRGLGVGLWILAIGWTLWEVSKLGPSDFGEFKGLIFIIFAALGVGGLWMLRDYLVVRALCILILLCSWWVLAAAYLQAPVTRLFLVGLVYVWIVAALYLAVAPWRARDLGLWLGASPRRVLIAGVIAIDYGIILLAAGATYGYFG